MGTKQRKYQQGKKSRDNINISVYFNLSTNSSNVFILHSCGQMEKKCVSFVFHLLFSEKFSPM